MSTLFSIIAAIIHIGDIDFIEDHSDRHMAPHSKVINYQQLEISKCQLARESKLWKQILWDEFERKREIETHVQWNKIYFFIS